MNMYFDFNYWNMFYEGEEDDYEWYNSWKELSKNIPLKINPDSKVLHIGCGFSTLGDDLYKTGIQSIINIDFSETCINKMKQKYTHLNYIHLNALDISREFKEDSFDLIIDKGCMDSILCDENYQENTQQLLISCHKTLKSDGCLVIISVGSPPERLIYFKDNLWEIDVFKSEKQGIDILTNFENEEGNETINDLRYHYIYICRKKLLDNI